MSKQIKIEPNEWYTLSDVVRHNFFPWANSFSSVRGVVRADASKKNILKCTVQGEGRGTKYHFKGSNIIKFVEAVTEGKAIN